MHKPLTQVANRSLSMTLHRDLSSGDWLINNIEIRYGSVRNKIDFGQPSRIQDTFHHNFLTQLKPYLPANLNQQITSVSGVAIKTESMVMEGMRVLSQTALHGIQKVIIRFNSVIGRIYDFLLPLYHPDAHLETKVQLPEVYNGAQKTLSNVYEHEKYD